MFKRGIYFRVIALLVIVFGLHWALISVMAQQSDGTLSGQVIDANGPVSGANVRVRATDFATMTDDHGYFTLTALPSDQEVEVTAWFPGYYIAYISVTPPAADILLTLRPYHTVDHPDYVWGLPIGPAGDEASGACGQCHPQIVAQWSGNAHGQAINNPRFFSMYNGTTLDGSAQSIRGYQLDFPGTTGNCASCHAPGAGVDGYLTSDMNTLRNNDTAGIHCDYCHKIGGVYLDPATQLPYANAPGVESQRLLRPPTDDNIFFGPYDDIHDPDTYLPEISESTFCAPCHQFSMWGTPIYQSYAEWLASPYAGLDITCQDCHMPPTGDTMFATIAAGGVEHTPDDIPSHLQLGAVSAELLQDTVELALDAQSEGDTLDVTVTITNTNAGHHVPTDYPGRHMILTVTAQNTDGSMLNQIDGPIVPDWGGPEAGQSGNVYAKVLRDVFTGEAPVVSYWSQTQIASDNRIAALESDATTYRFALPPGDGDLTISAALVLRRVFYAEAAARGWDTPDMLMESVQLTIPR